MGGTTAHAAGLAPFSTEADAGDLELGEEGVAGEEGLPLAAQVGREAEQEKTGEELLPRRAVQAAEEEAETRRHGRPYLTPAALLLLAAKEDASPPITASSAAAPATALELGSTLCFPQLAREGERSWFRSVASAMAWAE
jgi:hypothetical protein